MANLSVVTTFSRQTAPLPKGSGDGTYDDMLIRIATLESDVRHISQNIAEMKTDVREMRGDMKTDFRILFGALIATTVGIAGLMARGFGWL